jgi:hypothetical protein
MSFFSKPTNSSKLVPAAEPEGFLGSETRIDRLCGFVVNRGAYGEKCWKVAGHPGEHQGSYVSAEDLRMAREDNLAVDIVHLETTPPFSTDQSLNEAAASIPGQVLVKPPIEPVEPSTYLPATPAEQRQYLALAAMQSNLQAIADRFNRFESNAHQLNLVAGELVEHGLKPMKAELAALRYNLGDKANTVVGQLEGLATHLDKQLGIALKLQGQSDRQAKAYRGEFGICTDIPSIKELSESGVKANETGVEALLTPQEIQQARERQSSNDRIEALEAENERLRTRLAALLPHEAQS